MARNVGPARRVKGPARGASTGGSAHVTNGGFGYYAWEFPRRANALPIAEPAFDGFVFDLASLPTKDWGVPGSYASMYYDPEVGGLVIDNETVSNFALLKTGFDRTKTYEISITGDFSPTEQEEGVNYISMWSTREPFDTDNSYWWNLGAFPRPSSNTGLNTITKRVGPGIEDWDGNANETELAGGYYYEPNVLLEVYQNSGLNFITKITIEEVNE